MTRRTRVRVGKIALVLLLGLGPLSSVGHAALITSTWQGPADGKWSDPANWDSNRVPNNTAADTFNVIVNSGSIRLDLDATIDGLTLSGGSINAVLSQSLVVNKAMAWTSGTVGDFVAVTAKGDVTIGPGALPPVLKGTLNNEKSATLAGTLRVGGALSQVANAGTFTLKDDAGFELTEASASFRFDNTGSFAKPGGGTGTSKVVGFFANKGGTVELKSGTLDVDFFRQEKGTTTLTKGSTLVSANDLNFFSGQLGGLGTVKGPNVINGGKLKAALANNAKLALR